MPEMIWTEGFSVGVPLMDDQHKRLIALINLTNASCSQDSITQMFEYAELHFKTEETMLRERRYPELDTQLREHAKFLEHATSYLSENLTDPKVCSELNRFLCQWLSHHILELDMKYKHFLLPVKS